MWQDTVAAQVKFSIPGGRSRICSIPDGYKKGDGDGNEDGAEEGDVVATTVGECGVPQWRR
jgi:hypothetical protein